MTNAQLMFEYMMEYAELYLKVYDLECRNKIKKDHNEWEQSGKGKYENSFYNFRFHEAQMEAKERHPRLYMRLIEVVKKINELKQEPEK